MSQVITFLQHPGGTNALLSIEPLPLDGTNEMYHGVRNGILRGEQAHVLHGHRLGQETWGRIVDKDVAEANYPFGVNGRLRLAKFIWRRDLLGNVICADWSTVNN